MLILLDLPHPKLQKSPIVTDQELSSVRDGAAWVLLHQASLGTDPWDQNSH